MSRNIVMAAAALFLAAAALAAGGTVAPADVAQRLQDPQHAPFLLDVRTPDEFAEGHVPGAVNVPVQVLAERLAQVPKDREVVVYCESGRRAARAATLLREQGYTQVTEMQGSMKAWREAQLPVQR